ncbi:ABC transporter substrate-binding protein [Amaricoccus solimangrovi]|uniref:ABC transporter substrate-binding protein n=1 Tax=Amaricoccus solimangrovi TaxID=2589815 RepID=UPI0015E36E41|nr:extracellular solute-binding protein [Amaricoccus solimangrovi]
MPFRGTVGAAALAVACGAAANAAGAFDTTESVYAERAADAVAAGRIKAECLPSAATAVDPAYRPIPAPSAELVEAARAEGSFVLNSGISDKPSVDAYQAAFQMRYPEIRMSISYGGGPNMEERFMADHAAGSSAVDAVISVRPSWVAKAMKEGAILPLDNTIPGFFDAWPGDFWVLDTGAGRTATAFYRPIGIAYNSDLVTEELAPRSYQDLTRPEFKDQLLGLDPQAAGIYAGVWKHILDSAGEDTMRALGENLIKTPLYADIQPAAQALGAGAGMVIMEMGGNIAQTMRSNGASVEVVIPEDATGSQYAYAVSSQAPHPNAAALFAYWLYSAEGQWVMSCSALAGTVAYPEHGAEHFAPVTAVAPEEMTRIRELLGL